MTKKLKKTGQKSTLKKQHGTKTLKPWLVALDPFSDIDVGPALDYLRPLAERAGAELLGVFILAPETFNWTGEFSGPWIKKFKPIAEEKAKRWTREHGLRVEIVPCRMPGLRHSVATMSQFAKKVKADKIVVFTHARHGMERWLLGSFTESLILMAGSPVMVINPSNPLPIGQTQILLPTDLSPGSSKFILQVGALADSLEASLHLFYKQPDPLDPIIQQGVYAVGGGWVSVQSYIEDDMKEKESQIQKLAMGLRKRGLAVDSEVVASSEPLIKAILSAAKTHGATMIALKTHTGPISAAVLGSVARELVREATLPVLIWKA